MVGLRCMSSSANTSEVCDTGAMLNAACAQGLTSRLTRAWPAMEMLAVRAGAAITLLAMHAVETKAATSMTDVTIAVVEEE